MKGLPFSKGRLLGNNEKYIDEIKKIFSFRTTGPISTKLDTKYPWVKEIQVCSYEGPRFFPRVDNNEIAKMYS